MRMHYQMPKLVRECKSQPVPRSIFVNKDHWRRVGRDLNDGIKLSCTEISGFYDNAGTLHQLDEIAHRPHWHLPRNSHEFSNAVRLPIIAQLHSGDLNVAM